MLRFLQLCVSKYQPFAAKFVEVYLNSTVLTTPFVVKYDPFAKFTVYNSLT